MFPRNETRRNETMNYYESFTIAVNQFVFLNRKTLPCNCLRFACNICASRARKHHLSSQCNFPFLTSLSADYVRKYATEEALRDQENGGTGNGMSSDSESSMSDFSEDEAQDMEL